MGVFPPFCTESAKKYILISILNKFLDLLGVNHHELLPADLDLLLVHLPQLLQLSLQPAIHPVLSKVNLL
jgi:hypothetical protein